MVKMKVVMEGKKILNLKLNLGRKKEIRKRGKWLKQKIRQLKMDLNQLKN